MRTPKCLPLLVLAALTVGMGACSDDPDGAAPTTSAPPTTTSGAEPTTTSGTPIDVRDWDGVLFDLGIVDRIDRLEDGSTVVYLDRVQLDTGDGRFEGADFTEEPIVVGNTDHPFVNENDQLRAYVVASDAEVLRIDNLRETCTSQADAAVPRWTEITVDEVVDGSLWDEYTQVSLSFDDRGLVWRIRFSSGC